MEILGILLLAVLAFGGTGSAAKSSADATWSIRIGTRPFAYVRRDGESWRWESSSSSGTADSLHGAIVAVGQALGDFTSSLVLESSDNIYRGTITPSQSLTAEGLPLSFAWNLRIAGAGVEPIEFFGDEQFRASALGDMMEQLELELPAVA